MSRLFFRVAFVFEPLSPRVVSYYLTQRLKEWKRQMVILDYRTRTKRLGKFHYKTQIDLDLSADQTARILDGWVDKLKKTREVV